jgi:hypothetical protein
MCMVLKILGRLKYITAKPSALEVEVAIEKMKWSKSPGTDHIPSELIQAGGRIVCSEFCKFINYICNKE